MVNVGNNFNNQFMRNFSSELLDIIEYEIQKKIRLGEHLELFYDVLWASESLENMKNLGEEVDEKFKRSD